MKNFLPITIFVIGLVLIFLGLEASDSLGSAVSEAVNDAPSNKSIFLIAVGAVASIWSGTTLVRSRS